MKYKQPLFLLAVILTSTAPIFADKIPGESKSESKGAISAQALAARQGLHDLYAAGDCGLSGAKENQIRTASSLDSRDTHFIQSDNTSGLGSPAVDLGSGQGNSSDKNKGKSGGKGNGSTNKGGSTAPVGIAVSEPGTQLLLLAGLAGLGIFFLRRNSYQNANECQSRARR